MQKQAPTIGRILVMAIFALSCFGLLLYLWSAFGGPVPLKPHGYRFETSFAEATQLAQEADVRISGVNVGRVKKIDLGEGRTNATIELDDQYAPIPQDSRAILRQKTLLGETYVELTPGTKTAPDIPEGGTLTAAQVAPTVELDEILRAFDKKTREGFQTWQQDLGKGIEGQGAGFSEFLGVLPAFATDTNKVVEVLNSQERATREAIKNTGVVFDALTERGDQLAQWINNSNDLLRTTGRRDDSIRALFRAFPTFIDESNATLRALAAYSEAARLAPGNDELLFWQAATLWKLGREKEASPLFRKVFARDRRWVELPPRLVPAELLPDDPASIRRIQALAPPARARAR